MGGKYLHEWRQEHVQLSRNNKRKLWFRLLKINLHLHDFDPYAIFKCDHSLGLSLDLCLDKIGRQYSRQQSQQHKTIDNNINNNNNNKQHHDASLYSSNELQLRSNGRDKFRQQSTRPLKLFAVYFLIKAIVISLAHHTLMRYEYLVPKKLSRPLLSLDSAQLIARHLGIAFYALKDISLTLSITATCFANICVVVLPINQRLHPVNIASLRFVLDPQLELRRVDASIRRKLAALKCSLQVYQLQQADQYRQAACLAGRLHMQGELEEVEEEDEEEEKRLNSWNQVALVCHRRRRRAKTRRPSSNGPAAGNQRWMQELERREQRYCQNIEMCLDGLYTDAHQLESLRPSTFEPVYFVSMTCMIERVVVSAHANYLCIWLVITSSLVYSAYSNRCPQLDCNPLRVFSTPEMLVAAEAQTILAITCFSCSLNFTLLALLTANQLKIIKSIRQELQACKDVISKYICIERVRSIRERKLAGVISSRGGENLIKQHPDIQREELERLLLKSIARLEICDREIKDNARCISQQTVHPACYMASALFLAALNVQFKLPDWNFLRFFYLGVIWLSVNIVAVSCANTQAQILNLQRNLWSILALCSQLLEDNYYIWQEVNLTTACKAAYDDKSLRSRLLGGIDSSDGGDYNFNRTHPRWWRDVPVRRSRLRGKCCTFVVDLWIKFVYSTSANIEQHCSRLLGMDLSYQNIIEANFFSIFIYSLTLTYDR